MPLKVCMLFIVVLVVVITVVVVLVVVADRRSDRPVWYIETAAAAY